MTGQMGLAARVLAERVHQAVRSAAPTVATMVLLATLWGIVLLLLVYGWR